jgi:hypothetical protein
LDNQQTSSATPVHLQATASPLDSMAYRFIDPTPFLPRGANRGHVEGRKPMFGQCLVMQGGTTTTSLSSPSTPSQLSRYHFSLSETWLMIFSATIETLGLEVFSHVLMVSLCEA